MEVINRYVTIKTQINGKPNESDFEIKSSSLVLSAEPGSNDVVLKNLYVSMDPYQINRMKAYSSTQKTSGYATAITPGFSGLTAYAGFFEVCKPKKGEKVFVSAASGSVGHLVGQYAKHFGCYVVGSAGSKGKVALVKDKLGFDDAFNYKDEPDLKSALKKYFPEGIDIYFDNVGAEMLEAAVANMNTFGRIAVCGVISEYTDASKRAAPDMLEIVYKKITIRGFLAEDFMNLYPDLLSATVDRLRTGTLHTVEDISTGLESIPQAFIGLFHGSNVGKTIVKLVDE